MPVCQICDKRGHAARVCWYRYDEQSDSAPSGGTRMLHASTSNSSSYWYLDTGANSHVAPDYSQLNILTSYSCTDTITVGNGQSLLISNRGSCYIDTPHRYFLVVHITSRPIPNIHLLSVYMFTKENNCTLIFNAHNFMIVQNLTKKIRYMGAVSKVYTLFLPRYLRQYRPLQLLIKPFIPLPGTADLVIHVLMFLSPLCLS